MSIIIHDTLQSQNKPLPLVSVIMPFAKWTKRAAECVTSVIEQTYPEWELICAYYGEDEFESGAFSQIKEKDSRIRLFTAEGLRPAEALNAAIKQSDGDYIQIINPKDTIESITLDLAVTKAVEYKADLVVYDWRYYYPKKKKNKYNNMDPVFLHEVLEDESCRMLLESSPCYTCSRLYSADLFNKKGCAFESDNIFKDELFRNNVVSSVSKAALIPSPLYKVTASEKKKETEAKSIKKGANKGNDDIFTLIRRKASSFFSGQINEEPNIKDITSPEVHLRKDTIVFMGFNTRYTGNSRFLFEEMLQNGISNKRLFYITDDPRVHPEHRIAPGSEEAAELLAQSGIVILESWISRKYKKPKGALWIQLWHGTPLKKMCFDSSERTITLLKPNHKNRLFNNINKWDYLLADCPAAVSFFRTCFLMDEQKIKSFGYPRVKYLIDNRDNETLKNSIRRDLNIPERKKVLLYLPTWRDYNYGTEETDFDLTYLADLNRLQEKLGDEYQVVYKDHPYLSRPESVNFRNYSDAETQELLLVADALLTDYSSVMFDAFAIDVPVLLYCNDFEKNENARGVYPSIWEELKYFCCSNEEEVSDRIRSYTLDEHYCAIRDKYSYNSTEDKSLTQFIYDL